MKTIVKTFVLIIALSFPTSVSAQIYGIRGGFNLSNLMMKYGGEKFSDHLQMRPGFHLGPTIEIPLSERISIDGALLYSAKGVKMKESESYMSSSYEYKSNTTLNYLELPLDLKAKVDVGNIVGFGALGPYFAYALSGKTKDKMVVDGNSSSETTDIDFGDDGDLKRMDFGLGFSAGVEVGKMQFGINYGLGLSNITQHQENDAAVKNRNLSFFANYRFLDN